MRTTYKVGFGLCLVLAVGCAGQVATGGGYTGPSPSRLCAEHLAKVAGVVKMYAADHDEKLPGANWIDSLGSYRSPYSLVCPAVENEALSDHGYAMNSALTGVSIDSISDSYLTVFFFETADLRRNLTADPASILTVSRHEGTIFNVRFDGSVQTKLP